MLVLLWTLPAWLHAGPAIPAPWDEVPGGTVDEVRVRTLRPTVELPPVTAADLVARGDAYLGEGRRVASGSRGALSAPGGLTLPPLRPFVQRELTALWSLELPAGNVRMVETSDLRVYLRHADGPLARAEIRPVIQDVERTAEGGSRVTGGAVLLIPTDALEAAGRFQARVEIDVEYLR